MLEVAAERYRAFDTETHLHRAGLRAPPAVCGSTAWLDRGEVRGELLRDRAAVVARFKELLDGGYTLALAMAAYDLAVVSAECPALLPGIFRALAEGRIHCILVSEALHAIYCGHLGEMPHGGDLVNAEGKPTNRYSLYNVTGLVLGRWDAKEASAFRKSYALLEGTDPSRWPEEARVYPVDDSRNTLEAALAQRYGQPGRHAFVTLPRLPGDASFLSTEVCSHCGKVDESGLDVAFASEPCYAAPRVPPHKNLENLAAQVEADFCLHLGACWSLRTDPVRVAKLSAEVDKKHAVAVKRFQKFGWIRENGTEDESAVKSAIARAYGAGGACPKCGGSGKVPSGKWVPCRGQKERGRFRGCQAASCAVCSGTREVWKYGNPVTCRAEVAPDDKLDVAHQVRAGNAYALVWGCDGTGLDFKTARGLPRTDTFRVGTDRDTTMESGDDELSAYGENEFEKSRTTYIPYLWTGTVAPLYYSPNVVVATGRASVENSPLHQMPRNGGERECVRARGAWCGYPIEMVLGSTDYEAGELCTLAQFCYWVFGRSHMRDAINASGKPGILHSDLAAQFLGISLEEFLVRLKAKDRQAVDFRQAAKPINFGTPGGMGTPKFVLTQRKKSAGFTVCETGPALNDRGEPGYHGIRFCVLTGGAKSCGDRKITEWGKKKYAIAPVCAACANTVEHDLRPVYFRRYPEVRELFKWATKKIDDAKERGEAFVLAPTAVWDQEAGRARIIRERAVSVEDFPTLCNNAFQPLLADIMKAAFVRATRECYLGVKEDGSPSPFAGCRIPLVIHDEPLSELILSTAHESGPRLAEILVEEGYRKAPDVVWRAETALAFWWSKKMEPVHVDGMLVPWDLEKMRAAA